ncbi:UNVERIFIED_CONTAM: hypothetical protein RMT77_018301 [Armadillidium vulgare]
MKFSAEILLTVLMGSLLCFQLALAQCDKTICEDQGGCCCPETKGCYPVMNGTVTNYFDAENICLQLSSPSEDLYYTLPEPCLGNIEKFLKCKVSFTFI